MSARVNPGDTIKILDTYGADWVTVGDILIVDNVEVGSDDLISFRKKDIPNWFAKPEHYKILSSKNTVAKVGDNIRIINILGATWLENGQVYTVSDIGPNGSLKFEECPHQRYWANTPSCYQILREESTKTMDSLLQTAIDRYPIGTYYLPISSGDVDSSKKYRTDKIPAYHCGNNKIEALIGGGLLYYKSADGSELWAPIVHKDFEQFEVGDKIIRWKEPYSSDWTAIGKVSLPKMHEECTVLKVKNTKIGTPIVRVSYKDVESDWLPSWVFVKEEFYTQTKPGTGSLNTNSYGKNKHNQGSIIEVCRPVASITPGKRITRSSISGRRDATTVRRGHISHTQIVGK